MTRESWEHIIRRELLSAFLLCTLAVSIIASTLLAAPPASALSHYEDRLTNSTVHITGGAGSFSGLSETNKTIYVQIGQTISGNVSLVTENNMLASDQAYLIGTTNWGQGQSSYWTINEYIGIGLKDYTSNVSVKAPLTPGTYYIVFAFNAEFTAEQVASCTNWRYGQNHTEPVKWNDGNDVAGLTPSQIKQLQSDGRTKVGYLFEFGYQSPWSLPGDAITVIVQKFETIFGRVTDSDGSPMAGIIVSLDSDMINTTDDDGRFSVEVLAGPHNLSLAIDGYQTRYVPLNSSDSVDLGNVIVYLEPIPSPPPTSPIPDWVPFAFTLTVGAAIITIMGIRKYR